MGLRHGQRSPQPQPGDELVLSDDASRAAAGPVRAVEAPCWLSPPRGTVPTAVPAHKVEDLREP